ncbi:hypothetical protein AURDEDRAFT_131837 [Auricularia subglabra TFB-10046 SS5]|uniref:Uncharacterized protein n=1 Tax=Auricularia subglabra (strain TFB-10046 / SS5) TaxID=717982 RepID=J0CS99_AURST|nr:hypothetical protein AURDEDRAFT_131837 [Auricularia subglabra TFB-10046 SS5]
MKLCPIPARCGAAVATFAHGGAEIDKDGSPCSTLISVNLDDLSWEVQADASDGIARVRPALAVSGNKLYIFGGYGRDLSVEGEQENSYSVLEFDTEKGTWFWAIRYERPPENVRTLGSELWAVRWELGILVVCGRAKRGEPIDLGRGSYYNYEPVSNGWSSLTPSGTLPPHALWYEVRKSTGSFGEVLICVWHADTENVPIRFEAWKYSMMPVLDDIREIGLREALRSTEEAEQIDLEMAHSGPDGRMLLVGGRKRPGDPRSQRWDVYCDVGKMKDRQN